MKSFLLAMGLTAALVLCLPSQEATAQSLRLELNRVDQQGEACRFDWRITNGSAANIEELTVEFVLFDRQGVNIARMPVPFGALLPDKSYLRSFVLRPFECAPVGELLVNDVTSCVAAGDIDCLAAMDVSSRAGIALTR